MLRKIFLLSQPPSWPGVLPEALTDTGAVEIIRVALLSQEGSTIETAVEIVRGVVP